jgi:hypothetical protein
MDMITASDVIAAVEKYSVQQKASRLVEKVSSAERTASNLELSITKSNLRATLDAYIPSIPTYPDAFRGEGIVICAGGRYLPAAWVCIKLLQRQGCKLPVELWYLGEAEMDAKLKTIFKGAGVNCIDALNNKGFGHKPLHGWQLKPYAILNSTFKEVLLLDADNVCSLNPAPLFKTSEYKKAGAVFWKDAFKLRTSREGWECCGLEHTTDTEFESGQILVDKERCWKALYLALWLNTQSKFFYRYLWGDKETFQIAFRLCETAYAMPQTPPKLLEGAICHHDFKGRRIFQHRNSRKWSLYETNQSIPGFALESECLEALASLREALRAKETAYFRFLPSSKTAAERRFATHLANTIYWYNRIGWDSRQMTFLPDGRVGTGSAGCELYWDVESTEGGVELLIASEKEITCRLSRGKKGVWTGTWLIHQKMAVELVPFKGPVAQNNLPEIPTPKTREVIFRATINSFTGYGLHALQIVRDLEKAGCEVKIKPLEAAEQFSKIPRAVKDKFIVNNDSNEWELLLHPPDIAPTSGKRTVFFTMWEATRLPEMWVKWLNAAECVVVPCQWNASCFAASGVDKPIKVIPLGIKADIFTYKAMDMTGPCVFGAAGKMRGGGERKGLNEIVSIFQEAFPSETDVRLKIKGFPDCGIRPTSDSRVDILAGYISEIEMANWYASLTAFVSISRSEGWGLMPHQAMAVGRPAIATKFGGHAEYLNESVGYCIDFDLVAAGYNYTGGGVWAEPKRDHLIFLMREVYRNRKHARDLGRKASRLARSFTWERSNQELVKILEDVGMISPLPRNTAEGSK